MSIKELDLYCRDIATAYSADRIMSLRAIFIKAFRAGEISKGLYDGLNRELRDRADWLKRR